MKKTLKLPYIPLISIDMKDDVVMPRIHKGIREEFLSGTVNVFKHLPNLRLAPMGLVPQRDRRDRIVVDYSYW